MNKRFAGMTSRQAKLAAPGCGFADVAGLVAAPYFLRSLAGDIAGMFQAKLKN